MPVLETRPTDPMTAQEPGGLLFTIALCGLAGWVDAIGYIHCRGLFVSFMSGNTTTLGVLMSSHHWRQAAEPASVLVTFVAGVIIGAVVSGIRFRESRSMVLLLQTAFLAAATLSAPHGFPLVTSVLLATGMGVQSAAVHRVGSAAVAVTYVTGTLVNLGRGLAGGLTGRGKWREVASFGVIWLGLLVGALVGSSVAARSETVAFILATSLSAALSIVSCCLTTASLAPASSKGR